jgi:hypothetical protein
MLFSNQIDFCHLKNGLFQSLEYFIHFVLKIFKSKFCVSQKSNTTAFIPQDRQIKLSCTWLDQLPQQIAKVNRMILLIQKV